MLPPVQDSRLLPNHLLILEQEKCQSIISRDESWGDIQLSVTRIPKCSSIFMKHSSMAPNNAFLSETKKIRTIWHSCFIHQMDVNYCFQIEI